MSCYSAVQSEYSINGGKINKLRIRLDDWTIAYYGNDWEVKPNENDPIEKLLIQHILEEYN